jgi:hypothetical protein
VPQAVIGIIGAGRVGTTVARRLLARRDSEIVVYDANPVVARRLVESLGGRRQGIVVGDQDRIRTCTVVVIACPAPHARAVEKLAMRGCHVVSTSDDADDVRDLLELDTSTSVIAGAAASPGLTGLISRHLAAKFNEVDEIHVASHGTGGPACAQQHHRALAGTSIGLHDGTWLKRPAGSGRELCWFPDPVGGHDCYRSESPDPMVLSRAFPSAVRITARVSATRRDRLTSRLPMLTPPHPEGGLGAVRVEVRGWRADHRHVEVIGVAERLARLAGLVAAACAVAVEQGQIPGGVHVLGSTQVPNDVILGAVTAEGIRLQEFIGTSSL